jgi:hypothetical protein
MADIFANTNLSFGGAFSAARGIISMGTLNGILMQNLNINYQQNITRIYELGNLGALMNVYYIGGRSSGTASVAHILGPNVQLAAFYSQFSDVCQANNNSLQIGLGGGTCSFSGATTALPAPAALGATPASFSYTAQYCVLMSVGLAVSANDIVINSQSQIMFSNLAYVGT